MKQKEQQKDLLAVKLKSHRHWHDELVWSSSIYVIAGLFSAYHKQWVCSLLQIGAGCASTAFHKTKETKYLPHDALISSTLGIIGIWCAVQVFFNEWYEYVIPMAIHSFFSVFSWIYCGLPGGKRYDKWHAIWHYASACTTTATTIFLIFHFPDFDQIVIAMIWSS